MSKVAEAIQAYIESAYSAMGRELPNDMDFAIGICQHWTKAGKIMEFKEWCKIMGLVEDESSVQDENDAILDFQFLKSDGSREPIPRLG